MPHLKRNAYFSVLQQVDVILETFPFGGGNTMLQSIAVGTPYVSLRGTQLRGSFGCGFYTYIGEEQFIAKSVADYIQIALGVAADKGIKQAFRDRVKASYGRLFDNMAGSDEFYEWMRSVLQD